MVVRSLREQTTLHGRPMHVAQFVHRYPPAIGGAEAYTARLCDYLASRGDSVTVWTTTAVELEEFWHRQQPHRASALCYERRPLRGESHPPVFAPEGPPWVAQGGSPVRLRFPPLHFPLRRYVLKALSLLPIRRWQCLTAPCNPICPAMWRAAGRYDGSLDAVHATAFPYSFPIASGLRLARRRGVPFFLTPFLHLGDPTDPRDRTRRQYTAPHLRGLLRQADGVFVQTRAERDLAVSLGVPEARVHLQGLGVEPSDCTGGIRDAARARWGMEPGEVVVGHLANASEEKGTCDLLRAAERAWAAGQRFRVVLAGPEMPNFRAFWASFAAKERVTRLGVLTDEQKRDFFAGLDVFALPSRTDSFGLVLLEAWANSKPNLVYRAGGPAELVRDGIDGLHAKCGDVARLTMQLGRLVADAGLRTKLGEAGLSRVGTEFLWRDKLELVRHVLASGGVSRLVM
jgi:glycosyltransferase involved in cell wall biosynthesis